MEKKRTFIFAIIGISACLVLAMVFLIVQFQVKSQTITLTKDIQQQLQVSQKLYNTGYQLTEKEKSALQTTLSSASKISKEADNGDLSQTLEKIRKVNQDILTKQDKLYQAKKEKISKKLKEIKKFKETHGALLSQEKTLEEAIRGIQSCLDKKDMIGLNDSLEALNFSFTQYKNNAALLIPKGKNYQWRTEWGNYDYLLKIDDVKKSKEKVQDGLTVPSLYNIRVTYQNKDVAWPLSFTSQQFMVRDNLGNILPLYSEGKHSNALVDAGSSDTFEFSVQIIDEKATGVDVLFKQDANAFYRIEVK